MYVDHWMDNFVSVGMYTVYIVFVGKIKYICYLCICVFWVQKEYSQIFYQHTYVYTVCSKCYTEQKKA